MSNAKHTAGPWAVNPKRAQVDAFVGGNPLPVCQLLWPTLERSEAETEANARLIAAAPELLASLSDVLDDLILRASLEDDDLNISQSILDRAQAAIAKATGA